MPAACLRLQIFELLQIKVRSGPAEVLEEYADPDSCRYAEMVEEIRRIQNFTTLRFHRLDDLLESIGLEPCKVCTYCFNGKE